MSGVRRVTVLAAATATVATLLAAVPPPSVAAGGPACPAQSVHNSHVGASDFAPDSSGTIPRPVVLVHGWDGSYTGMQELQALLTGSKALTAPVKAYLFDYAQSSGHWAAIPEIASCLADYINTVSRTFKNAHGDGKVIGVGHSMGGLALRFATSPAYAAHPVSAAELAGVVTLDTPHLGSPWGDTPPAQIVQNLSQLAVGHGFTGLIPWPPGTDGQTCLAYHSGSSGMPPGCATPTWLPAAVPITQVAGDVIVNRQIMGVTVYTSDTHGDGVVPVGSSTGYASSGPGTPPKNTKTASVPVTCEVTTGQLEQGLTALPGNIWASAISILESTLTLGDGRLDGPLPSLFAVMDNMAPCGHTHITSPSQSPKAAQAVINAINQYTAAAVGPVTAHDLLSEPVPSMCEHPAGRLVNGVLPGIPADKGGVGILNGSKPLAAFTDLNGDGVTDAVVVGYCNQGGVGWPDWLLFYTGGHRLLAAYDMGRMDPDAEHVDVASLSAGSQSVTVKWSANRGSDSGANLSLDESAEFRISAKGISNSHHRRFTEVSTARKLLGYANRQDYKDGEKYATAQAFGTLQSANIAFGTLTFDACYNGSNPGMFPDSLPTSIADQFPELANNGDWYDTRMCVFHGASGQQGVVVMSHVGFGRWQAIAAVPA